MCYTGTGKNKKFIDTEENPEDSQETEEKTSEAEPTTEEEPEENVEI